MNDDLLYEDTDATLADVVQAMAIQLDRGQQFYAYKIGRVWCIFWNGPVYTH